MPTYEDLIKFVKLICKSERTEEEQEFLQIIAETIKQVSED